VTAHEEDDERVVLVRDLRGRLLRGGLALPACVLAAVVVDQPPLGRLDQPAARLLRNAVPRPVLGGGDERLLNGILGRVEIAEPAGEHAEDLRRQLAQQALDVWWRLQRQAPFAVWRYSSIPSAPEGPSSMIRRT